MIVGNGLIASAFSNAGFHSTHHVIFASGVSNSSEINPASYERELLLLEKYLAQNTTFVYFSTTSIFDPTKQGSIYILHKKAVENLIRKEAKSFIIVRLPILLGRTSNPYTLINYLVNAILSKRQIQLHRNACRHFLDVDDLPGLLFPFFENNHAQLHLNILGSEKTTIPDLILEMEKILSAKGLYLWEDTGACYDIPHDAGECLYIAEANYTRNRLHKYLAGTK